MIRKVWTAVLVTQVVLILTAAVCFGAGFALYEGSARGNALGGGLVGRADDPSALFFNPAGITQLSGLQMQAGATFIFPEVEVDTATGILGEPAATTKSEDNVWIPPHAYLTYQISDQMFAGLGVFSAFGLGTEFPEDWPGRFNNTEAVVESVTINPNIAFKVTDALSLAAGLDMVSFDLTLKKKIPYQIAAGTFIEIDQSVEGDDWGYGFNLALHYKPNDTMAMGISYRSSVKQEAACDIELTSALLSFDTSGKGEITLPDELFFGVAFYPADALSLEVGGVWTRWSTYDELSLALEDAILGNTEITYEKNWDDVWRFNVSAEYEMSEGFDLRVGYAYDPTPVPDDHVDYLVPANDRHLLSFGSGFAFGQWSLDLSYTYLIIKDRDVAASPDLVLDSEIHDGVTHLFGVTMGYVF